MQGENGENGEKQSDFPLSSSTTPPDPYTPYENSIATLLQRMDREHPRYNEALVYEHRLRENIAHARLDGDNETRRSERFKILRQLNTLAYETLNTSFNALCEATSTMPSQDRRNRTRMLQNVHDYWIKGVLEQSLYREMLIDLGIEYKPDAVQYPWDMVLHRPDRQDTTLPANTKMIDVFTEARGELLILGAPGAGKTTMLLDLARTLIERAQQDETLPIPVVFNLSTWATFVEQHNTFVEQHKKQATLDNKQATLDDWLIVELKQRYSVPKKTAQAWVEQNQILLLLDGLDEVQQQHRASCVEAINAYRKQDGLSFNGMIVCSRIADYEELQAKLTLQEAIKLQPLTEQQIDTYLAQAGDEVVAVRTLLHEDAAMRELADTPLMLSILVLAYKGVPAEALPDMGTLDERRTHLFDHYVQQMLKRRGKKKSHRDEQITQWISWLAEQMVKHGKTVFYLEEIQPTWLVQRWQWWVYRILSVLGVGLVGLLGVGLVGLLGVGLVGLLGVGLVGLLGVGLSGGLVGVLLSKLLFGVDVEMPEIFVNIFNTTTTESLQWSWREAIYGLFASLAVGLYFGVLFGLAGMLFFGLDGILLFGLDIQLVFVLIIGLFGGLFGGLLGGLGGGLVSWLVIGLGEGLGGGLFGGLGSGIVVGLAGGVVVGLGGGSAGALKSKKKLLKTSPNEGIWNSLQSAIKGWLVSGLGVGLGVGLVSGLGVGLVSGLGVGLVSGLIIGLFVGLENGGSAFIIHFTIRTLLALNKSLPFKLVPFLEYARERIFLRRVGSGYIFIHRTFLEHLAELAHNIAIDQSPNDASSHKKRGDFHNTLGRHEQAIIDYTRAIELDPKDALTYYQRGLVFFQMGDDGRAVADFNKENIYNPSSTRGAAKYRERGDFHYEQREYALAIADYTRAIDLNPKAMLYYLNRGVVYVRQGEYALAIADYTRAIDLNLKKELFYKQRKAVYYNNRGVMYARQGEYPLALADYSRAIDFNPKEAIYYKNRGVVYARQGKYEWAIDDYNRAIGFANSLSLLGSKYTRQGEYALALTEFTIGFDRNQKEAWSYIDRGFLCYRLELYDQAITEYTLAINLQPDNTRAFFMRGFVYEEQEKCEQSQADYSHALDLNSKDTDDYSSLCWLGSLAGFADDDKVIEAGETVLSWNPSNGEYRDIRGLNRALRGDYTGAIEDFQAFVVWAEKEIPNKTDLIEKRKAWIEALQRGENPFDEATLDELRRE
jgi:tetratricopeptide (TPR) repeat protein/GTPase SAR1 family protein